MLPGHPLIDEGLRRGLPGLLLSPCRAPHKAVYYSVGHRRRIHGSMGLRWSTRKSVSRNKRGGFCTFTTEETTRRVPVMVIVGWRVSVGRRSVRRDEHDMRHQSGNHPGLCRGRWVVMSRLG
jgi:hypothetical protein